MARASDGRGGGTVVVIGGGLAGLSAADALLSSSPARASVTVLEASARVGGRTASMASAVVPGAVVDIGGQWFGARQEAALALGRELGIRLLPQYCEGRRVVQMGTDVRTYAGLIPNVAWSALVDVQLAIWCLKALQALVGCFPAVRRWADRTTMAAMAARLLWTTVGTALLRIVVQALFGAEPEAVSVLAFCRYVTASDSIERMSEIGPGSLQCWTLAGGAQQLSLRLADRVLARGGRLLFNRRVVSVERGVAASAAGHSTTGSAPCRVVCDDGSVLLADTVIVAMAPPIAARIRFNPPLPPHRVALGAESRMGCIIKALVLYPRAFWRHAGYSGEVICDTASDPGHGPAFNIFDGSALVRDPDVAAGCLPSGGATGAPATPSAHYIAPEPRPGVEWVIVPPPPGTHGEPGRAVPTLVAFINGARAAEWSSVPADERRTAVLRQFARWFGSDEALAPLEYIEQDWTRDPFAAGCPIASYGAGVLGGYGLARALAESTWQDDAGGPCRLHFAGTEVSPIGTGFMDGAIRSGHTAAAAASATLAAAPLPPTAAFTFAPLSAAVAAPAAAAAAAADGMMMPAVVTDGDPAARLLAAHSA